MIPFARPFALALRLAAVAPLAILALPPSVHAQAGEDAAPQQQIALTDAQVQAYLAAQSEIAALTANLPEGGADKPDPKLDAQFDAIARKYKFASYDNYGLVEANIGMVIDGVDPETKKYVGATVVINKEKSEIKADKSMTPADKKQALDEMNGALKSVQPLKFPANVDVVLKYYDKLAALSSQTD